MWSEWMIGIGISLSFDILAIVQQYLVSEQNITHVPIGLKYEEISG